MTDARFEKDLEAYRALGKATGLIKATLEAINANEAGVVTGQIRMDVVKKALAEFIDETNETANA